MSAERRSPEQGPAISEVIRRRCSVRTYTGQPVEPALLGRLGQRLEAPPAAPFGSAVRLALIRQWPGAAAPQRLGTYGMIRGAETFLVGAVRRSEHDLEDYGYLFQWALLQATALGLGTCWLGGTFRRGAFGAALGVASDERVPAVSPVGYARVRRSAVDAVVRWAARSARRQPFETLFFEGSFQRPLTRAAAGQLAEPLELLRLGPSASNRQPWRVVRRAGAPEALDLYLCRTPGYRRATPVDLQRVDMGIAMCHLALGAREVGLGGQWHAPSGPQLQLPPRTEPVASWLPD